MDAMDIWKSLADVPEIAKKPIGGGRLKGMTDINPIWRIQRMTECFGTCGLGWWYDIIDKRIVYDEITNTKACFVDIMLYIIDPVSGCESHGIPGTGGASFVGNERNGAYMSDECFKMALTDALSVAMKALGVGASVYWGQSRTKYDSHSEQPRDYVCSKCGKVITGYTSSSGKTISAEEWAANSKERYGAPLCIDCAKAKEADKVAE